MFLFHIRFSRDITYGVSYLGQVLVLLFLRAISMDLIDTKIRMRTITKSDGSRCSAYFLHDNYVIEIRAACATIFRFHRRAQQAQLTQLPPKRLCPYHFFLMESSKHYERIWNLIPYGLRFAWIFFALLKSSLGAWKEHLPSIRRNYLSCRSRRLWAPALFARNWKQVSEAE